ncbi:MULTISPECIES: hypothetical protein [Microbacterium]|uniref:Uncharacterized protein n=1 Tax=Microbacterium wangchenii TaxID=2541726 RepID=A0ABX5SNY8_9MICO|nr:MULTISPECIES: hypothetical protein [Microbacterium]MCK6068006.1 hypothetical protein [Microbacterium sp. EYE_512]QBR87855.1 hypothetical protein E4K62_03590 [Microbacterium wangchenii]TFV84022.1 hypothetical protein E4V99_02785 [Microbacterium sp. dk485]TXK16149.1 hypothetical protein FVP99_11825 [Microbacterium wangchenii]
MTIADNCSAPAHGASEGRVVLVPIGAEDWLIHDTHYPENDARRLVACVRERGLDHIDVLWLQGKGLPSRFPRIQDALDAATRAVTSRSSRLWSRAEAGRS